MKQLIAFSVIVMILMTQASAKPRGIILTDSIHSKILSERRDLLINLPSSYDQNKTLTYPVVFLTDGLRNFNHASGTLDLLTQSHEAQEMIIIAIKNTQRARDFTPTYDESYNKWGVSGGADNFLDFIEHELIPHINENYRTNNFKILSGHSLGGLLVIHSLQTRPELFQAHFAFSPSLWWHDGVIFKNTKTFYEKGGNLNSYLYMNLANEKGQMLSSFEKYEHLLKNHNLKGFSYDIDVVEEENHSTSAMVGHNKAYTHLYKQFQCPTDIIAQGIPAIEKYYMQLSKKYKAEIKPSYHTLAQVAGIAYNKKDFSGAIEVYKSLITQFPHLSDPHYRIAYIYETQGKYNRSIEALDKALNISTSENVENNKYKALRAFVLAKMNNS
ncbi:alpha/beta hydrolase-fold protein [Pseudoalteromonas arabiensis]|uniref:alpha/beta hydrolase-fold protein n=1 Tax=Pseudoalteromonas arabiensis TaxID=874454 RepID=UPI0007864641|nr:alpha/beta hydrolase-fold protein [Pseudoalteromonas arabiensis]